MKWSCLVCPCLWIPSQMTHAILILSVPNAVRKCICISVCIFLSMRWIFLLLIAIFIHYLQWSGRFIRTAKIKQPLRSKIYENRLLNTRQDRMKYAYKYRIPRSTDTDTHTHGAYHTSPLPRPDELYTDFQQTSARTNTLHTCINFILLVRTKQYVFLYCALRYIYMYVRCNSQPAIGKCSTYKNMHIRVE